MTPETAETSPQAAMAGLAAPADTSGSLLRHLRPIWHIQGDVPLPDGQPASLALDRLEPLFHAVGTRHERLRDGLIFHKQDPAAQDRLAVFDSGILRIESGADGPVLRYQMRSKILLASFLAPLLFLSFAQITIWTDKKPDTAAAKLEKDKKKKALKELPRHPIDIALGAPPPKTIKEREKEKAEKEKEPASTTPAFVFAGIFAALYLVGRFLEQRLASRLFQRAMQGEATGSS